MRNVRVAVIATGLVIMLLACSEDQISVLSLPPVLDFDFTDGAFPAGLTFTRNSSATYVGEDGLLKIAPAHTPRFDYNPDPGAMALKGLLIEERATNLVRYSEQLERWTADGTNVLPDRGKAPSGEVTADLFVPTTTYGRHLMYKQESVTVADTLYTLSCYFKPDPYVYAGLFLTTGPADELTNKAGYIFDVLHNKALPVSGHPAMQLVNPVIQKWTNDYYRCSFSVRTTRAAGVTIALQVRPDSARTDAYQGNGRSGGYVWGAQLEMGLLASSYIPTASTTGTRETDLCLIDNLSNWYNKAGGTWVAETFLGSRRVARIIGYDGSGNFLGISPGSQAATETWNGAVNVTKVGNQFTGIVRHAMTYTSTSRSVTREGLKPAMSKTSNGNVTKVAIGANPNGKNALNAHIRRIQYYPLPQPDSLLQVLTQ